MQLRHALLADRVHAREDLLRRGDGLVGDMLDQLVRRLPGLLVGLAHDDVQADAEDELSRPCAAAAAARGRSSRRPAPAARPRSGRCRRVGGDLDAGVGRAAEIERRMRLLHRRKEQLAALDADVLALEVDRLAGQQLAVDVEELAVTS